MVNNTVENIVPGNTLEEKEKYILDNYPTIAIMDFVLSEYDNCIEDFISNFLTVYNKKYKTSYSTTYETAQCNPGKLRSLLDVFLITKHYFPSATLKEVIKAMNAIESTLHTQVCSTVKRRVYWHNISTASSEKYHPEKIDEFGYKLHELKTIIN